MQTVFVAGSIAISRLDNKVKDRISNAVDAGLNIAVGDADGADTSIQNHLLDINAKNVIVFCSGQQPRNNVGEWPTRCVFSDAPPGTRAFFTAKDIEMAHFADYGLMVWDSKSTGTLSNVIELVKSKKRSVVFVNKCKEFRTVHDADTLEELVKYMSESARIKAEQKIKLSSKLAHLKNEQFTFLL